MKSTMQCDRVGLHTEMFHTKRLKPFMYINVLLNFIYKAERFSKRLEFRLQNTPAPVINTLFYAQYNTCAACPVEVSWVVVHCQDCIFKLKAYQRNNFSLQQSSITKHRNRINLPCKYLISHRTINAFDRLRFVLIFLDLLQNADGHHWTIELVPRPVEQQLGSQAKWKNFSVGSACKRPEKVKI